jgi:hypothetical protein
MSTGDKPTEGRRNDVPTQQNLMHLSISSGAFESVEAARRVAGLNCRYDVPR